MRKLIIGSTFIVLQLYTNGQSFSEKKTTPHVSIELSMPHSDGLKRLNNCISLENDVFVILKNNTDSTVRFYENWNSFGYYNFSFEIKTKDSLHLITRPQKLWYRNYPTHHTVLPKEVVVFPFDLIDTTCAKSRFYRGIDEDGWIGLPNQPDTAQIRVIYSVPEEFNSYSIGISRKEEYYEYIEYTDSADIEIDYEPVSSGEDKQGEDRDRIWIYSDKIASEWKNIIIMN